MQKKAQQTALNLLARRDHSQHELIQKLKTKGYPPDIIEAVIAFLLEKKFLDDHRFTENYIRWRSKKGIGPERIRIELQARGISQLIIAEHLEITDNAWFAEIKRVFYKRFKGKQPTDFKERAKQMRFLQYRGFTPEQITSLFDSED